MVLQNPYCLLRQCLPPLPALSWQKSDAELAKAMKEAQERADQAESAVEKRRAQEQVLYQQELEKQLEDAERRKQAAYEEFLRDKLLIDEIVRKIYEEDERLAASREVVPLLLLGLRRLCRPEKGLLVRVALWFGEGSA